MDTFNYRVQQGERWDHVAQKMYGSMVGVDLLIQANLEVPLDGILPDDTILFIPIIENNDTTINPENLPPWKR